MYLSLELYLFDKQETNKKITNSNSTFIFCCGQIGKQNEKNNIYNYFTKVFKIYENSNSI